MFQPVDASMPESPASPLPAAAPVSAVNKPVNPLLNVTVPPAEIKLWETRIADAEEKAEKDTDRHQKCLERYAPMLAEGWTDGYYDEIHTNLLFAIVERKSADLFYKRPDLTVTDTPLIAALPNSAEIISAHAAIVNHALNAPEVDALDMVDRALLDYQLFGVGPVKIGYRVFTQDVPDPINGGTMPVPMKSECFIESFSPKKLLIPKGWRSTNYEKGPWIGWRGEMPLRAARRAFALDPDWKPGAAGADATHFNTGDDAPTGSELVTYVEVFYKSSIYRDDRVHPDHLTQIVFVDGIKDPVVHRDSLDQTFDAQGRLTADSLIGFPIDPMCLRVLTDASRVQSDAAMILPAVAELDTFRSQQVLHRDVNLQRGYYNTDTVAKDVFEKAQREQQGGLSGMPPEFFTSNSLKWNEAPPLPPDNWQTEAHIKDDVNQITHITANQQGAQETGQTATEATIRQQNVNAALGKEQNRIAKWYLRIAGKLGTLKMRYLSVEDAAAIVGPQNAAIWNQGRELVKTIPNARFEFTMMPDSALKNDTPTDRKQLQDLFTFLANDPSIRREYFVEQLLLRYHVDPAKAVKPAAEIPKPEPKPIVPGLSFKGEDFMNPAIVAMIQANPQWGVHVPPEVAKLALIAAAQPAMTVTGQADHPGKVAPVESLDKHATDLTGGMSKTGALISGAAQAH